MVRSCLHCLPSRANLMRPILSFWYLYGIVGSRMNLFQRSFEDHVITAKNYRPNVAMWNSETRLSPLWLFVVTCEQWWTFKSVLPPSHLFFSLTLWKHMRKRIYLLRESKKHMNYILWGEIYLMLVHDLTYTHFFCPVNIIQYLFPANIQISRSTVCGALITQCECYGWIVLYRLFLIISLNIQHNRCPVLFMQFFSWAVLFLDSPLCGWTLTRCLHPGVLIDKVFCVEYWAQRSSIQYATRMWAGDAGDKPASECSPAT